MKQRVSVIIPTYKRDSVREAVESVLSQDYPEVEIIVVDDNADYPAFRMKTEESLHEFIQSGAVKLIKNKKNLGGALSRNVGIKASSGEFIAFLDDDDRYLEKKISKQVLQLESSEAAIVYCWSRGEDRNGSVVWENKKSKEGNLLVETMTECIANTSLIMCRRDALFKVGLFSDTPCKQDVLLELKLAAEGYSFACVKEVLVIYGSADSDFERISNVSQKTITGFCNVRDFARTQYGKLTKKEIAFVEGDTAYKICMTAKAIHDRETFNKEFAVAFRNSLPLKKRIKLILGKAAIGSL